MSDLLAWVGDGMVAANEATVSVFDRAFRGGEGVFETMRAYGSHVFRLDRHLDRALAGAEVLGFTPPSRESLRCAVTTAVTANAETLGQQGGAVRLTVTPGAVDPHSPFPGTPDLAALTVVTVQPVADMTDLWANGVRAATVPWGREVPSVKAVSYVASSMARRRARDAGADEALFTDDSDHVLEASAANVFAIFESLLVTPPVDAGLLPGITRQAVLEVTQSCGLTATEAPLTLSALIGADEAFLTASTREIVPLVAVDGEPIGSGHPGPRTAAIHAAYRTLVQAEGAR